MFQSYNENIATVFNLYFFIIITHCYVAQVLIMLHLPLLLTNVGVCITTSVYLQHILRMYFVHA